MKETHQFQTEVKQLLSLVINSLYSNREIFLRELISNASDAIDKLRFLSLNDPSLLDENRGEYRIDVDFDREANTITVKDNGIGMNKEEVIENLGTIAQSGTKAFFERLSGDAKKDASLIGQFGVGFYSAFIVADKVTVVTRKAGDPADKAARWESDAGGDFTVEDVEKPESGTEIILSVKNDCKEFVSDWTLRRIVTTYSDHISVPIYMKVADTYDDDGNLVKSDKREVVNQAKALWTRPKSEVKEDEYKAFYRHIAHDFQDPLGWIHSKVEGKQDYTQLLYIPRSPAFDAFDRETKEGVRLYVRRVFIMEDAESKIMPRYLRFVRGVIDADDLPLNVSREILQQNRDLEQIRAGSVKKLLGYLSDMKKNDFDKYEDFWGAFSKIFKEGLGEDYANQEKIAELCLFASSKDPQSGETVSLDDYISRMKEGQGKIYYITAANLDEAINSPQMEVFKKKGVEVLLMTDRVDEWVVGYLTKYKDKPLASIAKGEVDLGPDAEEEKEELKKAEEDFKDVVAAMKEDLKDVADDVKVSSRLTDSAACLVTKENERSLNLQRMLEQAGAKDMLGALKPILEINPKHMLIGMIKEESDPERRAMLSRLVFDQAQLAEGGKPENPALFVRRMNDLLLAMKGGKA